MVLSTQGKEPTSHCKLTGSISRRLVREMLNLPPNSSCVAVVGMIKVSVVTSMCWREIASRREYSCQATAKQHVSHPYSV